MDFTFIKQIITNSSEDIIGSKYLTYLDQFPYSLESLSPEYKDLVNGTVVFEGADDEKYLSYNSICWECLDRIIGVDNEGEPIVVAAENLKTEFYTEFIDKEMIILKNEFNLWKVELIDTGDSNHISKELDKMATKLNLYESEIQKVGYLKPYYPIVNQFTDELTKEILPRLKGKIVNLQPISTNDDISSPISVVDSVNRKKNKFNGMLIDSVKEHFEKLTTLISKDGKPILTIENLNSFIKIAFLEYDKENPPREKIKMNFQKGEIQSIKEIFYQYYKLCEIEYEPTRNVKGKYVKLLTDYFIGFSYKTISDNFNK